MRGEPRLVRREEPAKSTATPGRVGMEIRKKDEYSSCLAEGSLLDYSTTSREMSLQ